MTRDYIAEALAIAENRSILRPERLHLLALYIPLKRACSVELWEEIHADHPYPQPEPEAEFERRTRG